MKQELLSVQVQMALEIVFGRFCNLITTRDILPLTASKHSTVATYNCQGVKGATN